MYLIAIQINCQKQRYLEIVTQDFQYFTCSDLFSFTVFAGVKAAVFSGEKKSRSRGAAYTQQQQNSAVKTSRPFARMGLYER